MADDKATPRHRRQEPRLPMLHGTVGPDVVDIRKLYAQTGDVHLRSRLHLDRALRIGDHLYRRRRGRAAPPRLSDRPARRAFDLHGGLPICCSTASCRRRTELDTFTYTITRHTMLHEQLATFYRGFRRDAHPMAIMCGVVGALSAFYHDSHRHHRSAAADDREPPADRQDADDRGDGVQIFGRPAVPLSAEQPRPTPAISCA